MALKIPKKEFTAVVFGRALREAHCEQCGSDYFYVLSCQSEGHGATSLLSPMEIAEELATKSAEKSLLLELGEGVSAMPCPKCGWLQSNMVKHLRANRAIWASILALFAVVCSGYGLVLSALIALMNWQHGPQVSSSFVKNAAIFSLGLGATGVLIFAIRYWRVSCWDPNDCDRTEPAAAGRTLAVLKSDYSEAKLAALLIAAEEDQQRQVNCIRSGETRFKAFGAVLLLTIALGFLGTQHEVLRAGIASFLWKTTTGKLVSATIGSEMRRQTRYYWPEVQYDYEVAGQLFHGTQYCVGTDDAMMQSTTAAVVRFLQDNPDIVVYYDPKAPGNALLKRGLPFWKSAAIAVFTALGGVSAVTAWRSMRKSLQPPVKDESGRL